MAFLKAKENPYCTRWDSELEKSDFSQFVPLKASLEKETLVWKGLDSATLPTIYFLNEHGDVRGHFVGLCSPEFLAKWFKLTEDTFKKHDSLVFRSRGRLNTLDSARLAFSWAMRLEPDRAKSRLIELQTNRMTEEVGMATLAMGEAFLLKRDVARASEAFASVEGNSRETEFRVIAKLHIASILSRDKPEQALEKLKKIARLDDIPIILKWTADQMASEIRVMSWHGN